MSFESSPHKSSHSNHGSSSNTNNEWTGSSTSVAAERPSLGRSAATTPSYGAVGVGAAVGAGAGVVASGSGSNPWADDDEDFGKEKEVEMSFE